MTEVFDVTIDGVGYMLRPGSYQRQQAGASEARVGRVRVADFFGGARRAMQNERDRFWSGAGVVPAYDSQAVTAGPKRQDKTETVTPAVSPTVQRWSFAYGGSTYLVQGSQLYKVATSGGNYGGLTAVQALAATVVDCVLIGSVLWFAYGAGMKVGSYDLASATYTAGVTIQVAGGTAQREARLLGVEGDALVLVYATDANVLSPQSTHGVTSVPCYTGSAIRRLVLHDGHCWAVCDGGLYRLKDTTAIAAEASYALLGYSDDASWAVSHLGQLFIWLGKSVVVYGARSDAVKDLSVGSPTRLRSANLGGLGTNGACSVGTWLLVTRTNQYTGLSELWGNDGRGWWLLEASTGPSDTYSSPVSLYGAANDADFLAGRGTTSQQTAIWQLYRRSGQPGLRSSFQLITPLLDAGVRDVLKVWRRAGVEVVMPEGGATSNAVTVQLEYSTDAGGTWTAVTSAGLGAATRDTSVEGVIAALPASKRVQLRVTVSGVVDWAPNIAAVWVEHETQDMPTRRRRWMFTVLCRDQVVSRDGSVDTTGARALALALWSAWSAGTAVGFKDVDYDLTGASYSVRVVGLNEAIAKPSQGTTTADSDVLVTLVEV